MSKTEQDIITAAIDLFAADAHAPMTAVAKGSGTVIPRDIPRLAWDSFMCTLAPQQNVT